MRLRLPLALTLIFALGCMCGENSPFQQGMDQAMVENLDQLSAKVEQLDRSPEHRRMLELIARARADALEGRVPLVDGSVWLAEAEQAIADGSVSDAELKALDASYKAKVSAPAAGPPP